MGSRPRFSCATSTALLCECQSECQSSLPLAYCRTQTLLLQCILAVKTRCLLIYIFNLVATLASSRLLSCTALGSKPGKPANYLAQPERQPLWESQRSHGQERKSQKFRKSQSLSKAAEKLSDKFFIVRGREVSSFWQMLIVAPQRAARSPADSR